MARKVFFSFHYDADVWRVSQIRNSGIVLPPNVTKCGFIDSAAWESVKREGPNAIERWIDKEMAGTTVTVVLIGSQTAQREWVEYEIRETVRRGNGLLGVYIHRVLDQQRSAATQGRNPFDYLYWESSGRPISDTYQTYDWVTNNGRINLGGWVEAAAKAARK